MDLGKSSSTMPLKITCPFLASALSLSYSLMACQIDPLFSVVLLCSESVLKMKLLGQWVVWVAVNYISVCSQDCYNSFDDTLSP